jgi:hypothetical protein
VTGKTKDNPVARLDLAELCNRNDLELIRNENGSTAKPKASFCLDRNEKKLVCEWLRDLKFPDGYADNWARSVNLNTLKISGLKSHDCHIFIQRLLPVAFRDFLPTDVWEPLVELSNFFRDICSSELDPLHLQELESKIVVTLCKLEKIFPPGFFDSMEHLVIHLGYEARVGGPVAYRWMFPFERNLGHLKKKARNKSKVEGSIVEAYLIEEVSDFCSTYFARDVSTRATRPDRHSDDTRSLKETRLECTIFDYPGRGRGPGYRYLNDKEFKAAQMFMLLNCSEIDELCGEYEATLDS